MLQSLIDKMGMIVLSFRVLWETVKIVSHSDTMLMGTMKVLKIN